MMIPTGDSSGSTSLLPNSSTPQTLRSKGSDPTQALPPGTRGDAFSIARVSKRKESIDYTPKDATRQDGNSRCLKWDTAIGREDEDIALKMFVMAV